MDIEKSITAAAAVIGALTGLVTALIGLVKAVDSAFKNRRLNQGLPERETSSKQAQSAGPAAAHREEDTRPAIAVRSAASTVPYWLLRSPIFIIGALVLVVSGVLIAVLSLRTPSFEVRITKPLSGTTLNVKPVDNGTSAMYTVEGTYSGALEANGPSLYVLVRDGSSSSAEWYLQEDSPTILTKDTWYRRGQWRLEQAFVGRGKDDEKLKSGEPWEIVAVIAPKLTQPHGPILPTELTQKLGTKAQSDIVKVTIAISP